MAQYSLSGDTSGLPHTKRSNIAYEIEALTPREVWGAGNGVTSLVCRQSWDQSANWITDMVGEVTVIKPGSQLLLKRHIPEPLRYGEIGPGADSRVQFCTMTDQVSQYGNEGGGNFSQVVTNWPATDWYVTRVTFEAMPYAILHDAESVCGLPSVAEIQAAAGANAGAVELYRYVIRNRRNYSREQPIPAASTAGGFKVIDDVTPANRKPIGQVGFRAVGFSDVSFTWVRVPVGWPPPVGWTPPDPSKPWPPRFNPTAVTPASNRRTRDSFENCINDDWFDVAAPDGICAPPGTLLYQGYDDSKKYFDAAGQWVCDIVFNFKLKQALDAAGSYGGWNFYLTASGVWKEVSSDGTSSGTKPYQSKNFNALFQYT